MHQITAAEFKQAVEIDPGWASKLTEKVEITDYCDMIGSKITHLSPLLHFIGLDKQGNSADFIGCQNLKVAESTFAGGVDFSESAIEKIGGLTITAPNKKGNAAGFANCPHLKVAEGTFPGFVDFEDSGIERIGSLVIQKANKNREAAHFVGCKTLRIAEGVYPGAVDFESSGIEKVGEITIGNPHKQIAILDLRKCDKLTHLPQKWYDNPEAIIDGPNLERLAKLQKQRDAASAAQKTAPSLEI